MEGQEGSGQVGSMGQGHCMRFSKGKGQILHLAHKQPQVVLQAGG